MRLLRGAVLFLIYNAVFGILNAGTDMAAHVGGLAGGFVCGLAINPISAGFARRRITRAAILAAASIPVLFAASSMLPRPLDLIKQVAELGAVERRVNSNFASMLRDARSGRLKDAEFANRIQRDVIGPWDIERRRLAAFSHLPPQQQRRWNLVLDYMNTREEAWTALVKGLETHNLNLIQHAFQLQAQAQSKLQHSMQSLR